MRRLQAGLDALPELDCLLSGTPLPAPLSTLLHTDYIDAATCWSPEGTHLVHVESNDAGTRAKVTSWQVCPDLGIAAAFDLETCPDEDGESLAMYATSGAQSVCFVAAEPASHDTEELVCVVRFYTMQGNLAACHCLPLARLWRFHAGRAIFLALTDAGIRLYVCGAHTAAPSCVSLPAEPPDCEALGFMISPDCQWAVLWRVGSLEHEFIFVSLVEVPTVVCRKVHPVSILGGQASEEANLHAEHVIGRHSILLVLPGSLDHGAVTLQLMDARPGSQGMLICQPCGSTPIVASPSGHFFAVCTAARDGVHVLHGLSGDIMASVPMADSIDRTVVICGGSMEICDIMWHSDGRGLSCSCKPAVSSESVPPDVCTAVYGRMRFYALDG